MPVRRVKQPEFNPEPAAKVQANIERIYHNRGAASARHPRTGADVPPTGLGGKPARVGPDDELLDVLSPHFLTGGFDLKDLVRTICRSQVYQLSSESNDDNLADKQNYARFYPRRLIAKVL